MSSVAPSFSILKRGCKIFLSNLTTQKYDLSQNNNKQPQHELQNIYQEVEFLQRHHQRLQNNVFSLIWLNYVKVMNLQSCKIT
jgi:hypothetical protein